MTRFLSDVGIVLRKHNIGEKDQVVRVLTKDKGKMAFIAKGVRDPKSKKAGAVDLCMEISFQARESKGLPYLQQVKVVRSFRDQLSSVDEGFEVLRLVDDLMADEQVINGVYELVSATLEGVGVHDDVVILFQVKLLTMLGFLGDRMHRSLRGGSKHFQKLMHYWQEQSWKNCLLVDVEGKLTNEVSDYLDAVVKEVLAS